MIDIKKIRIRVIGNDGYLRTIILNENYMPIYYFGFASDFKPGRIKIINKNATAQQIIDNVDEYVHVPWN